MARKIANETANETAAGIVLFPKVGEGRDIAVATTDNGILISFSNGERLALSIDTLSPAIQHQAMLHGLKQKLIDAAAISRDTTTGDSATVETKYAAIKMVYDRITGNEPTWNAGKTGAETGNKKGGILITALARLYPAKSLDDLKKFTDSHTKEELAALRSNSKIAAAICEVQAERATGKSIDTDSLLGELGK